MCRHWKGHEEEKVIPCREGDGTHTGRPQYFPAVSQLSCTTQGAVPPLLGVPFQHHYGNKGSGSSTLRSLWRSLDGQCPIDREPWGAAGEEAPQFTDMGPPHTPRSHCQLAGCSLVPGSSAQPHHNLQLRDCSWQGTSLEINSDDIPANSGHGHNRITELGWGGGEHAHLSPLATPAPG